MASSPPGSSSDSEEEPPKDISGQFVQVVEEGIGIQAPTDGIEATFEQNKHTGISKSVFKGAAPRTAIENTIPYSASRAPKPVGKPFINKDDSKKALALADQPDSFVPTSSNQPPFSSGTPSTIKRKFAFIVSMNDLVKLLGKASTVFVVIGTERLMKDWAPFMGDLALLMGIDFEVVFNRSDVNDSLWLSIGLMKMGYFIIGIENRLFILEAPNKVSTSSREVAELLLAFTKSVIRGTVDASILPFKVLKLMEIREGQMHDMANNGTASSPIAKPPDTSSTSEVATARSVSPGDSSKVALSTVLSTATQNETGPSTSLAMETPVLAGTPPSSPTSSSDSDSNSPGDAGASIALTLTGTSPTAGVVTARAISSPESPNADVSTASATSPLQTPLEEKTDKKPTTAQDEKAADKKADQEKEATMATTEGLKPAEGASKRET